MPIWFAITCFFGSFIVPIGKEELVTCAIISLLLSILYGGWSAVIISRDKITLRYIRGGLILSKSACASTTKKIRIEWIKSSSIPLMKNPFMTIFSSRNEAIKISLSPYSKSILFLISKCIEEFGWKIDILKE